MRILGGILAIVLTACSALPASCPVDAMIKSHERLAASYDAELASCVNSARSEAEGFACMQRVESSYAHAWELYADTQRNMRNCQGGGK